VSARNLEVAVGDPPFFSASVTQTDLTQELLHHFIKFTQWYVRSCSGCIISTFRISVLLILDGVAAKAGKARPALVHHPL